MTTRFLVWIFVYFGLVLSPVIVLVFSRSHLGFGFWWDLAMILGFAGMGMLGIQFALTARFRYLGAPFGTDIIYYFHRYLAIVAFLIIVMHAGIVLFDNSTALRSLNPFHAPWYMTVGLAAFGLYLLLIVTSVWRKPFRIEYDKWRLSHAIFAVSAYLLSMGHIGGVGYLIETPVLRIFWLVFALFWLFIIYYVRILKPWNLAKKPYRVTEIRKEHGRVWTVALEPHGHAGFKFAPGQFAWVTFRASPFSMKDHPFSISSAPDNNGRLEFTIKNFGDFTSTIGTLHPGETAFVDGPHGVFTIDRYPAAKGFIFVAGGVGIAPVISMLQTLARRGDTRSVVLFYGNRKWDRIILREEIDELKKHLSLKTVHVLREPPADWNVEKGFITEDILTRHLPQDMKGFEVFMCGPTPMLKLVEKGLDQLGINDRNIHTEIFDLA